MTRLTSQSILATLAALGTSALVGCGSSTPAPQSPVDAKEVPGQGPNGKAQAGCSAAGCGGHADEAKTPEVAAPTDKKAADVPAADAKPADAAAATTADAKDKEKDPKAAKKGPKKGGGTKQGGAASCGAGTCSAAAPPPKKLVAVEGVGLGLRWEFLDELLDRPDVALPFVEISPENYMRRGGYFPAALSRAAERFGVITHGLTMSVGGSDPLDDGYLRELSRFITRVGAPFHTDHLCWSGTDAGMLHDLLPVPFTHEAVRHVAERMKRIQAALPVPFGLENVTYYAPIGAPEMREEDFLCEVLEATGAPLLLDVNNVYVNAQNHGFDAVEYLSKLPLERVVSLHVAGHHRWDDGLLIDTHGADVPDPVHDLLGWVIERTGPKPVVLERDQLIPTLDELLAEVAALRATYDAAVVRFRAGRGA